MKVPLFLFLLLPAVGCAAEGALDPNAIIDAWIASLGSEQAREAVASIVVKSTLTDTTGKSHQFEATFAGGGTYRLETVGDPDSRVLAYDGKLPWEKSDKLGFGRATLPAIFDVYRLHNPFYALSLRNWYAAATQASVETYDGIACTSYQLTPKGKAPVDELWTVETQTGRVRMISAGMGDRRFLLAFDDYRQVPVKGGLSLNIPFRVTSSFGSKKIVVQRSSLMAEGPQPMSLFRASPEDLQESETVTSVLNRYVMLARSSEQAKALRSRRLVETITTPATGISTRRTVTLKATPLRILIDDVTAGMGESVEGFDGKTGWELSEILGFRPLKPTETSQMLAGLFPEADRSLPAAAPLRKMIGERIVDDKRTIAIGLANEVTPFGVYYFDADDGHLLRIAFSKQPYARIPDSTIDYTDFRPVDGVDMAFTSIITAAATQTVISIETISNDAQVDDALFAPRKKFVRPAPAPKEPGVPKAGS